MAIDTSIPHSNFIQAKEKIWVNGQLVEVNAADVPKDPAIERMLAYRIDVELNHLYDDIQAGLFGEAAKTGSFCQYVQWVKTTYPKS